MRGMTTSFPTVARIVSPGRKVGGVTKKGLSATPNKKHVGQLSEPGGFPYIRAHNVLSTEAGTTSRETKHTLAGGGDWPFVHAVAPRATDPHVIMSASPVHDTGTGTCVAFFGARLHLNSPSDLRSHFISTVPSFLRETSDTQEPYGAPLQPNFRGSTSGMIVMLSGKLNAICTLVSGSASTARTVYLYSMPAVPYRAMQQVSGFVAHAQASWPQQSQQSPVHPTSKVGATIAGAGLSAGPRLSTQTHVGLSLLDDDCIRTGEGAEKSARCVDWSWLPTNAACLSCASKHSILTPTCEVSSHRGVHRTSM
mmetsp:Transcript_2277/g.3185  ORF Transcript_2277/g.3185 Transcript_2277/m.3185 type:complete len:310 (-) Transcript_2277:1644-2573(-)